MNKTKSNGSSLQIKKRYKRHAILASLLCGTALAGAGVGVGYAIWHKDTGGDTPVPPEPIPPTPSVYNYVEFDTVAQYFDVSGNQLNGFNEGEEYDEAAFIEYMEDRGLNGIDFGNRFISVTENAFGRSDSMESDGCVKAIKFSDNISIGIESFGGCDGLEKIILGNGDISIGDYSFYGCSNLTKISVDSNAKITSIGMEAFWECSKLMSQNQIEITNSNLEGIGQWVGAGNNAYIENANHSGCLGSLAFGNINISNLNSIGDGAFARCVNLTGITEWPTLSAEYSIGEYAFNETNLSSATLPPNIVSIGQHAFADCLNLTSIDMSLTNIDSIESTAFSYCPNLTEIVWPTNITSIGENAFNECYKLEEVILPSTITNIGRSAFYKCSSMWKFGFESGNSTLSVTFNNDAFNGTNLNRIELNDRTTGNLETQFAFNGISNNGSITGSQPSNLLADAIISAFATLPSPKTWTYNA